LEGSVITETVAAAPAFGSIAAVRCTNAATSDADFGDKEAPLLREAKQLEWELLRLSAAPPVLRPGRCAVRLLNGTKATPDHLQADLALRDLGKATGATVAEQVSAFNGVAGLTLAAVNSDKPKAGGLLVLGRVRVHVDINDDGLFVMVGVSYEWLIPNG
jgi:hypothetical protein